MGAPDSQTMQRIARESFRAYGVVLPMFYAPPTTDVEKQQYAQVIGMPRTAAPGDEALFRAATNSAHHHELVASNSKLIGDFLDGACSAVCNAWSAWQKAAVLAGVKVNGAVATGGGLEGPVWKSAIVASGPAGSKQQRAFTKAVAVAISEGWSAWQASVRVPELRWYPALERVAAAHAPRTRNEPCALVALTQNTAPLAESVLASRMSAVLADDGAMHQAEIFGSIARAFATCFESWCRDTRVTEVFASGPVPKFAPPAVAAAPVADGSAAMEPGGFV